jgi:argininosuccinate lyase
LKGLPLSYNRDLQEDKTPLFDAFDCVSAGVRALRGVMATVSWETSRMRSAADSPFTAAVDLVEWMVARGTPFREAHRMVGSLVRDAVERKVPLVELVEAHPGLGSEAARLVAAGVAVRRRTSPGAGGPDAVAAQMERFRAVLDEERSVLGAVAR